MLIDQIRNMVDGGTASRHVADLRAISGEEFDRRAQQEYREAKAQHDAELAAADRATAEIDGELANVRTLVDFKAVTDRLEDNIADLESAAARMQRHASAPARTAEAIAAAVKASAAKLLATVGITVDAAPSDPEVPPEQLEAQLAAEKRAAAAAEEALRTINERLAVKRRLLAAVQSRRDAYLKPALREIAEPLGQRFVRAIAELRECYSLLGSFTDVVDGHRGFEAIELSRPRLDTVKLAPDAKFKISIDPSHRAFWRDTAKALEANPNSKITLPKS
jgi:hypothetical protein